jgi:hypothetical protein
MILLDEFSNDTYKAMKLVKNRHHICWLVFKMQIHAVRLGQVKGLGIFYSYISSASYIRGSLLVIFFVVKLFINSNQGDYLLTCAQLDPVMKCTNCFIPAGKHLVM